MPIIVDTLFYRVFQLSFDLMVFKHQSHISFDPVVFKLYNDAKQAVYGCRWVETVSHL